MTNCRTVLHGVACLTLLIGLGMQAASAMERGRVDESDAVDARELAERHGLPQLVVAVALEHGDAAAVQRELEALRAAKAELEQRGLSRAQRREHLGDVMASREALIEAVPRDWAGIWYADQAADVYRHRLAGGTGMMARYGVLDSSARQSLRPAIEHFHDRARRAELTLESMMVAYEAQPNFADRVELQVEKRRIDDRYRQGRAPFLRGASILYRIAMDGRGARDLDLAVDRLERAAETLDPPMSGRARLYLAEALHRRATLRNDDGDGGSRNADLDRAAALYDECLDAHSGSVLEVLAATLGRAMVVAKRGDVDAGLARLRAAQRDESHRHDLFHRLLIADVTYRLLRDASESAGDERWAAAHTAHVELLDETFDGVDAGQVRRAVTDRIARIAPDDPDLLDRLPAVVTLARAEALLRGGDDEDAQSAEALFDRVAERDDVDEATRVTAQMRSAERLARHGDAARAAGTFLTIARDHAAVPGAERAMQAAASLALQRVRDGGGDEAEAQLDEALMLLLDRYPSIPELDRWRMLAAGRAAEARRYDDADALYRAVDRRGERWLDALLGRAEVQRARMQEQDDPSARRREARALSELVEQLQGRIERAMERGEAAGRVDAERAIRRLALLGIESHLAINDGRRALRALDDLADAAGEDAEAHADWLRLRIEALRLTDREVEAVELLRELADQYAERARPVLEAMHEATRARVEELRQRRRDDAAAEVARDRLLPIVEALDEAGAGDDGEARRHRLRRADALRFAERYDDALELYQMLADAGHETLAVSIGRAESLFALGGESNLAEAMATYRHIASSQREAGDDAYWLAELRMLEILERVDRNVDRILPRIERLRRRDPDFGGDPYRWQFLELRRRVRDQP